MSHAGKPSAPPLGVEVEPAVCPTANSPSRRIFPTTSCCPRWFVLGSALHVNPSVDVIRVSSIPPNTEGNASIRWASAANAVTSPPVGR
jgi:hypothetical protein